MDNIKPYKSQIRGRGQLTIPKKVREKGTLYDGEAVSIIPIGDSITFVSGSAKVPTFLVPIKTPLLINGPHFGAWLRKARGEAYGKRVDGKKYLIGA